jgi:hypothetical protein
VYVCSVKEHGEESKDSNDARGDRYGGSESSPGGEPDADSIADAKSGANAERKSNADAISDGVAESVTE